MPQAHASTLRPALWIAAGVIAVALAAWLLRALNDQPAVSPEAFATHEPTSSDTELPHDQAPRTHTRLSLDSDPTIGKVIGRLVDAYGEALANARVGEASSERPGRSAADGTFVLRCDGDHDELTLLVLAQAQAPFAATLPLRAGEATHDLGDLQLRTGGTLRGRVVDDAQQGIAGVEVTLQNLSAPGWPASVDLTSLLPIAITGHDGSYLFEHLTPGSYRASAGALQRQPARSPAITIADRAEVMTDALVLAVGYTLAGRVLGADDRAIPQVTLRVRAVTGPSRSDGQATTNDAGGFVVEALPPGPLKLEAYKEGFLRTELADLDATRGSEVTIRLVAGLPLSGTVVDASTSAPVERFAATIERVDDLGAKSTFDQQLLQHVESLRQAAHASTDAAWRAERATIATQLEARWAQLRAQNPLSPQSVPDQTGEVRNRLHGRFSFAGLQEGIYTVGIASPAHRFARSAPVEVRRDLPASELRMELLRGFDLEGVVLAKPDDAPIGGAVVELMRIDDHPRQTPPTQRSLLPWLFARVTPPGTMVARTKTPGNGTFSFPQMAPGSYFVSVRHEQCADHDTAAFALQTDMRAHRVLVERSASLAGRVIDVPASQAGNVAVLVLGGHGVQRTAKAQRDGSYQFEGLQPGEYYVRAFGADNKQYVNRLFGALMPEHAGAFKELAPRDVELAPGEQRRFDPPFDLPAAGALVATVYVNGPAGARCRVLLRPVPGAAPGAGGLSLAESTDATGQMRLNDVPAGEYELFVHGPTRQELQQERVVVGPGATVRVSCTVAAGGLRGRVVAVDGTPAAELRGYVWVLPGATETPADLYEYRRTKRVHRLRVRDGTFEDQFVTPGAALVVVDVRGRQRTNQTVTITASGMVQLDLPAGPRSDRG